MENEIDKLGFKLVDFIIEKPRKKRTATEKDSEKIIGVSNIMTFDNPQNMREFSRDGYNNVIEAYAIIGDKTVGLNQEGYSKVRVLSNEILNLNGISNHTDSTFIQNEIFEWVINIFINQKANKTLTNYIKDRIEENLQDYTFYHKIEALGIENSFKIGNVLIGYLTEDKLSEERIKFCKGGKSEEDFNAFIKPYENITLAITSVKATREKASKIAMNQIAKSIDVLKCFFINESLDQDFRLFDVDFRFGNNRHSTYLSERLSEEYNLSVSLFATNGAVPITINKNKITELESLGLKIFSEYLRVDGNSEIDSKIIRGVGSLGKITSTRDLYERAVKIISFFENIIIPENKPRAKGQTYLRNNVLPKIPALSKHLDDLIITVNYLYSVRDKYLHNGYEAPINLDHFNKIQRVAVTFLIFIIQEKSKFKSKEDFYSYFNIK